MIQEIDDDELIELMYEHGEFKTCSVCGREKTLCIKDEEGHWVCHRCW